jgi:glycosyltransferase involved in cell wall biosynthesis
MSELLRSPEHDYLLVADTCDPANEGILPWTPPDKSRFVHARGRFIKGVFLQPKAVRISLRRDIDTVIFFANPHFLTTWVATLAARVTGKRVLFWTQGWTLSHSGWKDRVRCVFFRLAHGLLFYGRKARLMAIERGFRPENTYVIGNSLDYKSQVVHRELVTEEELRQTRSALFEFPNRPLLLCCARLEPYKRLDLVFEAMCHLRQEGDEVNLLLVGAGSEKASLQRAARDMSLSVHFYGACYDEATLARLFMAADVTVVPGNIGLTAIHSLAYGTPVITHDDHVSQAPESESIVPGVTGSFFSRENGRDLARAIREWTESKTPRDVIRSRCYSIVERYFHPVCQREIIDRAVSAQPAEERWWDMTDSVVLQSPESEVGQR